MIYQALFYHILHFLPHSMQYVIIKKSSLLSNESSVILHHITHVSIFGFMGNSGTFLVLFHYFGLLSNGIVLLNLMDCAVMHFLYELFS